RMPSSIFDSYEGECRRLLAEARETGDSVTLERAQGTLARLEHQARSAPREERPRRMAVVAELKTVIQQLEGEGRRKEGEGEAKSTRQLVELGESSSCALNQAILNTVDAERTALEITSELAKQRDTMARTRANADRLADGLVEARGSVERMEASRQCRVMWKVGIDFGGAALYFIMDHAWAYTLPSTPVKSKKAVLPGISAAPTVLTSSELKARASRRRLHASLVTIVDRWERNKELSLVRRKAEFKRQSSAITEMAKKKTFSPCASYRIRAEALRNTKALAEAAKGDLEKALHDLALTLEDLHRLCVEYDGESCSALHFATKLEDAYQEELSLREDLAEAMARLEYPENFNGLQRVLVVFTELTSAGYSLAQACCAVADFQSCVVVGKNDGSDLSDRVKARLRALAGFAGVMRYKVNATDIIIATIVGGGSMLYTCYPILRRLEDHDK
ncbi:hypothetical protein FOZ62_002390, partial [Perkinsus olseni]